MDAGRELTIGYDHPLRPPSAVSANQFPVNTQEICYINLALPGDVELKFKPGETHLNVTNNLRIIPDVHGDVQIGVSQSFDTPLYWKLPPFFLGDRILSYNGHLRFRYKHGLPHAIYRAPQAIQVVGHLSVKARRAGLMHRALPSNAIYQVPL